MIERYSSFLPALLCASALTAQIPNAGFENWNGQTPTGWSTNNLPAFSVYPITQSTDAHSGSYAARGEVLPPPQPPGEPYGPLLQHASVPVDGRPSALKGWYKFHRAQSTTMLSMTVTVYSATNTLIGLGVAIFPDPESNYVQFEMPITYNVEDAQGASANIMFLVASSTGGSASVGSWFLVDDLSWEAPTSISTLENKPAMVGTPFPQPVVAHTRLPLWPATAQQATVEVLDVTGRTLEVVFQGQLPAGEQYLDWSPDPALANGTYLMRVRTAQESITRRLLLQR